MSWNYRVVKKTYDGVLGTKTWKETIYRIEEVHYNSKNKIVGITDTSHKGISPRGSSLKELKQDLKFMLAALKKPVLKD